MSFPQTIFGDPTVFARSLGSSRIHKCHIISDSIAVNWGPKFYSMLPQLRGMDDLLGRGSGGSVFPPAPPDAGWVTNYNSYQPRMTSGGGVLASNASNGATSLSVTPNTTNTGMWAAGASGGMLVTIAQGTNTDTVPVAANQQQSSWTSPQSVPLASGITHAYTAGTNTTVSWYRPSTVGHYYWGTCSEIIFSATSRAGGAWYIDRLCDWYNPEGDSGLSEDTYKQIQGWGSGSIRVRLDYLATPKATDVHNLQLNGRVSGTGTVTPVSFSTYAATPTIKSVSITLPAPSPYDPTVGPRVTVQSSGTGTFAAGDVFVPLGMYAERVDATDGYGMTFAGNGGYTLWDYANEGLYTDLTGGAHYPVAMAPAFISQYIALAGIDTLIIQLGYNDWVDGPTAATGYRQIIANARAGNPSLRAIVMDYYVTNSATTGASAAIQAGMQTIASADPGVLGLDMTAMLPNNTYNTVFTSDGTHPSNPNGDNLVAATAIGLLYSAANASTTASAIASSVWSYSTVTNRTVATGTNMVIASVSGTVALSSADELLIGNLSRLDAAVSSRMASATAVTVFDTTATGKTLITSGTSAGQLSVSGGAISKVVTLAPTQAFNNTGQNTVQTANVVQWNGQVVENDTSPQALPMVGVGAWNNNVVTGGAPNSGTVTVGATTTGALIATSFANNAITGNTINAGALNGKGDWSTAGAKMDLVDSPNTNAVAAIAGIFDAPATSHANAGSIGAMIASGTATGGINVGDVTVDWNYGTNDLRALRMGTGIANVNVVAYVASEYASSPGVAVARGLATTGDNGEWFGMGLSHGNNYTLVAYPPDSSPIKTLSLSV